MEKLTKLLETVSQLNINVDTDVLGYYWYKVELMSNIFGVCMVLFICVCIALFVFFGSK